MYFTENNIPATPITNGVNWRSRIHAYFKCEFLGVFFWIKIDYLHKFEWKLDILEYESYSFKSMLEI